MRSHHHKTRLEKAIEYARKAHHVYTDIQPYIHTYLTRGSKKFRDEKGKQKTIQYESEEMGKHHKVPHHPHHHVGSSSHHGHPDGHAHGSSGEGISGVSHSKTSIILSHAKMPKKAKVSSPCTYYLNDSGYITSAAGFQGYSTLKAYPTYSDVQNLFSMYWVQGNDVVQGTGLASVQDPIHPAAPSSTTGKITNTQDIWLHYVSAHHMITNCTNVPLFMKIYDFAYKGNVTQDTSGAETPNQVWAEGMKDATNQTSTDTTFFVGVSPMQSKQLRSLYKLEKVTDVVMPQSGVHVHKVYTQYHRKLKGEEFANPLLSQSVYVKHMTISMVVFYGPPLAATGGTTTFGPPATKIEYMSTFNVKYTPYANQYVIGSENLTNTGIGAPVTPVIFTPAAASATAVSVANE